MISSQPRTSNISSKNPVVHNETCTVKPHYTLPPSNLPYPLRVVVGGTQRHQHELRTTPSIKVETSNPNER